MKYTLSIKRKSLKRIDLGNLLRIYLINSSLECLLQVYILLSFRMNTSILTVYFKYTSKIEKNTSIWKIYFLYTSEFEHKS